LIILFRPGIPAPIGHSTAEAIDGDTLVFQFSSNQIKLIIRKVVNIHAIDVAGLDAGPSQFFRGTNLSIQSNAGFIGKSCIIHVYFTPIFFRF
jgi:hypothetical protein